ncbi:hypothetical protein AtubIFM55763_000983 [Aspergillus tubingensis]|nr:hypothetical protein AtubIFM55763_000983 [Aspergillus tubingensis]
MVKIQSRRIVLVGATGALGSHILNALLDTGVHHISVITRPENGKIFDNRVSVNRVDLDDEASLVRCLISQDALIIALSPESYAKQISLIRAAAGARVPYIVPTEFGSDPTHERLNREIGLAEMQKPFRALIEELGVSSWIGVVNGIFFDFNVRNGFWGLDIRNRKVTFYDDGQVKINTSTLSWIAISLARFFSMPDEFIQQHRNTWIYFSSFLVSQRDVFESAIRMTRTVQADWEVVRVNSKVAAQEAKKGMEDGDHMAVFSLLFALTFQEGFGSNFSDRLINYSAMGLSPPTLDSVVEGLVEDCT